MPLRFTGSPTLPPRRLWKMTRQHRAIGEVAGICYWRRGSRPAAYISGMKRSSRPAACPWLYISPIYVVLQIGCGPRTYKPKHELFIKEILMVEAPTIQAVISCSKLIHDTIKQCFEELQERSIFSLL